MPRKTARENPEDKLKNPVNALLFMQGKEMAFKGLDWLDFVRSLGKLSDAQKLERLSSLAAAYASPRVSIRTVVKDEEGNPKEVVHTSVPLAAAGAGEYRLTVPDLYRPLPERPYVVNDLLFYPESFTKDDHIAWERHSEEHKLTELFARDTVIRREMRAAVPTEDDINSIREQIPGLEEARRTLTAKQNAAFTNLELSAAEAEEHVKRAGALLSLNNARLKELRTTLYAWEDQTDPVKQAETVAPFVKRLGDIEAEVNKIFMTFVHAFAVRENMTTLSLDEWLGQAEEQDYSNALQWVALGNASRSLGKVAKPLTRDEERARELRNLKN